VRLAWGVWLVAIDAGDDEEWRRAGAAADYLRAREVTP
jgi:hypothetical protein